MALSKRLQHVADMVSSGGVVADIGCDHGFTSIYLVKHQKVKNAIAMDINKGPLERAKEHVKLSGFEGQIDIRLSDGLEKLSIGEADTILISGMGGALIKNILFRHKEIVIHSKELVLSPQSEIFLVRKALHELGFQIQKEEMVFEQGKFYVIMRGVPGREIYETEVEYQYGKYLIEKKDPVFLEYLMMRKRQVEKVIQGMQGKTLSEKGKINFRMHRKELKEILCLCNSMNKENQE